MCLCVCQTPHQAPGQPFKFTIPESLDRIKEEFQFLQAQYHRWIIHTNSHGTFHPVLKGGPVASFVFVICPLTRNLTLTTITIMNKTPALASY